MSPTLNSIVPPDGLLRCKVAGSGRRKQELLEVSMITAAQALVDCLRREGIDHVFGIPGTMNLPILDVLRATPEIRFILTRHEQGAAFMAYGFARAVNRPTVVTATEGPGVTN